LLKHYAEVIAKSSMKIKNADQLFVLLVNVIGYLMMMIVDP